MFYSKYSYSYVDLEGCKYNFVTLKGNVTACLHGKIMISINFLYMSHYLAQFLRNHNGKLLFSGGLYQGKAESKVSDRYDVFDVIRQPR